MRLSALSSRGDAQTLHALLANSDCGLVDVNQPDPVNGRTPLHAAAAASSLECVGILLAQARCQKVFSPSVKVDAQDATGSTALHIAVASSQTAIARKLLEAGASVRMPNVHGNRPLDYAKDPELQALLECMPAPAVRTTDPQDQRKSSQILEIYSELPEGVESLRSLCVDLIVSQSVFQARCKETIRQLVEEKHVALHKNRLLEQAAGIQDKETGERFIDQLHFLQDQNEKQANTIAYLETSIQLFEYAAAQQDEYYRTNMTDLTKQHNEQLQAIFRRNAETEKAFLAYQNAYSEDLAELARFRGELGSDRLGRASGITESAAHADAQKLRKKLAAAVAEKLAVEERLKMNEKLKAMSEAENLTLREDMGKLRKLMQEEVLKQLQSAREERDEMDESSGNILFIRGDGGQKKLKGAAPDKLLERLVDPSVHDHHYQQTIILTHAMFISTKALLAAILAKYREFWAEKSDELRAQSPVLLRIINLLKFWIEHHWGDFADDPDLKASLAAFIAEYFEDGKMGSGLRIAFRERDASTDSKEDSVANVAPKPILPRILAKRYSTDASAPSTNSTRNTLLLGMGMGAMGIGVPGADRPSGWTPFGGRAKLPEGSEEVKLKLVDFEPLELARQLTLMEFDLFKAIRSKEYLDLAWMKDSKETDAPNILRMTRWSNHVVQWIVSEIVSGKDSTKYRAGLFERVIMLGQSLYKLRNFNGVKEVVAALQTASVYRLKKTKEAISSKYMRVYDELVRLVSSELNYKAMRAKIRAADPPLIPFPGLFQGDLVFLDACQKNKLEGGNLINYQKLESISRSLMELEAYQQVAYPLEPVGEIQEYIRSYRTLDDDEAYNASLACEAKSS
ncbi:hypothetical protein HDU87_003773 [Geranomyces variabilis]|uniref:Uncharacterized protein n=1 Tax=Geranomyces variabilis TaxID=109894 RepID=A0AAD5TJK7_9FUNG|nr:hypothetical protein HDU87_003773 [Geranomyces variabilis]